MSNSAQTYQEAKIRLQQFNCAMWKSLGYRMQDGLPPANWDTETSWSSYMDNDVKRYAQAGLALAADVINASLRDSIDLDEDMPEGLFGWVDFEERVPVGPRPSIHSEVPRELERSAWPGSFWRIDYALAA